MSDTETPFAAILGEWRRGRPHWQPPKGTPLQTYQGLRVFFDPVAGFQLLGGDMNREGRFC